jgi:N-acetylmuramoyl-L-alanine amidase
MSRLLWKVLIVACALSSATSVAATKSAVRDVRMSASGETTRVVFDLSEATPEQVFTLHSPERVVIDLSDARLDLVSGAWPSGVGVVKEFRSAERGNGVLRIVLEVSQPIESRSFSIAPADGLGHRLVVDLASPGKLAALPVMTPATLPVISPPQPVKSLAKDEGRLLIIAVDAGHGGQDPGASGRKGTREKDVTLAIARKLKETIDSEPGMRAVLTRDGDYFVPLRERIVRASKHKADLFISIHADSVRDRDVAGSSVYVLSAGRASNEASRMLADRENAADLMGGMTLENKDTVVASVLLDLSQMASMSASNAAADKVLAQLDRVGAVLDNEVKHASLKVLTAPNMPSMLVETAFISNPKEEAKLNDARHQQRLADAILFGVRSYFYDNPPPGTRVAQRVAQQRNDGQDRATVGVASMIAGGIPQ